MMLKNMKLMKKIYAYQKELNDIEEKMLNPQMGHLEKIALNERAHKIISEMKDLYYTSKK